MKPDQRGLSGSVQTALLLPVVLGLFLATLQWGMIHWAQSTALAAAQEGAASAARGTQPQGLDSARRLADNGAFSHVSVEVDRGPTRVVSTVSGQALRILPLVDVGVEKSATVATERVTRP